MLYRFSVDQYHRMIDHGILTGDDRVELIDGWIFARMTQNPPHVWSMRRFCKRITRELPRGWCIRPQVPITTGLSEPEPDLSIVRGDDEDYGTRHPAEVGTLNEVADSSLSVDRGIKFPAYARAQIPVYWIINLVDEQVEVYDDVFATGSPPSYRRQRIFKRGDSVPLFLDAKQVALIPVDDLLP